MTRGGSSAYVGDTLRTTAGTWTVCGTTINYYIYEWLRAGGSIYTSPHTTATTNDHVTVIADLGATMQSRVQACSNVDGCSSTALSSNSISASNRAPAVPTSPSPANGAIVNSPVTLSGLFSDADTGQTGHLQFFLSGNGGSPWGSTVSSGQASSVPVSLTPGTTYTWYARATDLGAYTAQTSGATATYSFTVNSAPANPTSLAPANGRIENNETPTLSSTYSDPQSQSGYVSYTVKRASDNAVVASGHGPSVASGSTSSWTVPSGSLVSGTSYNWYAQAVDALGLTSASVGPTSYIDQYRYGLRRQHTYQEQAIDDQESLSVNIANGNLVLTANDLRLPGLAGFDLNYPRYYNSLYASTQSLGNPLLANKWETIPNIGVFSNGDVRYSGLSGYEVTFVKNGGSYVSPPGIAATLTKPDANYLLTFHGSGEQQQFSSNGGLLAYLDRNGNTISFNRSGSQLTSITDTFGHSTSFAYNGSNQLTTITDPLGHTYQYGYDGGGNLTSYTDPENKTRTYVYDGSSRLTRVTDALGHSTKISYDASGRVSSIQTGLDSGGNCPSGATCPSTGFAYAVPGGTFCPTPTTDVTDPNGGLTRYCFDARLRVTKVEDPEGSVSTTDYTSAHGGSNCTDGNGNTLDDLPCSTTDALGNWTTYGYDAAKPENKLWSQSPLEDAGHRTTYVYADPSHPYLPTSITDARGKVTSYTYDAAGNKTSTVVDGVTTEQFTYNARGQVASSADGVGKWTTFAYDADGHLTSRSDPLGNTTSYTYDDADRVLTRVDPLGNVEGGNPSDYTTTYSYDDNGRLLSTSDPLGYTTTNTYDGAGNKTSTTDGNGHTTSYAYDANNRLVTLTAPDPDGAGPLTAPVTAYTFDAAGNKLTQVNPRGNAPGGNPSEFITTYVYDSDNRLTSVTTPLGETTSYRYDENGNLVATVDPRGNVQGANPDDYTTTKTYDGDGHVLTERDPLGHTITYVYDRIGNRTSVTDANQHATTYTYDAAGRVLTVTAPDLGVTTYTYDGNGNKLSRTDANSHTTSYTYDDAGQLASVTGPDPDGGGPLSAPVTTYGYDANGNRTSVVDPNGNATPAQGDGTTTSAYDRDNRLTGIGYSDSTPDVSFTLDGVGKRLSMTDGAGTINYSYDADDRLLNSTRGADSFSYEYDAAGNVTSRTYPGGALISYGYDRDNRLGSVTSAGATTNYGYDPASNLTQTTLPATNGYVETRTYDRAGRVTEVKNAKGASVLSDFSYTLDPVGNPTAVLQSGAVSSTTTYGYDPDDRLTSVCFQATCAGGSDPFIRWTYDGVGNRLTEARPSGTTTYTYDADDRMLSAGSTSYSYDAAGNETGAGSRTFSYDLANRLISTTSGSTTTTYSYDGDGNRLQASTGGQPSDKTNYLWDTNGTLPQLAVERDGSNAVLRRYTYGVRRVSMTSTSGSYYYAYEELGSVVNVTSSTGATEWTYSYEPFGVTRTQTQDDVQAPTNTMKFDGELEDSTGLYYLRARQYDPATGRFLAIDPSPANTAYVSSYAFVGDRPTMHTDPSGLSYVGCGRVKRAVLVPLTNGHCGINVEVHITWLFPGLSYVFGWGLKSSNGFHELKSSAGIIRGGIFSLAIGNYDLSIKKIRHPGRGLLHGVWAISILLADGHRCYTPTWAPFNPIFVS